MESERSYIGELDWETVENILKYLDYPSIVSFCDRPDFKRFCEHPIIRERVIDPKKAEYIDENNLIEDLLSSTDPYVFQETFELIDITDIPEDELVSYVNRRHTYNPLDREILEVLIENGMDPNIRLGGDQTLLMRAAGDGQFDFVHFLLEHGADDRLRDYEDLNAFDWAQDKIAAIESNPEHFIWPYWEEEEEDEDRDYAAEHLENTKEVAKMLKALENQRRLQKFEMVTMDPRTGHHPIPRELFGRIKYYMDES